MSKMCVGTAHTEAAVTVNTFPWRHDSGINNPLLGNPTTQLSLLRNDCKSHLHGSNNEVAKLKNRIFSIRSEQNYKRQSS
jgi:hypothetical protein